MSNNPVKAGEALPGKHMKFSTGNRDLIFSAVFIIGTFLAVSWGMYGGYTLGVSIAHIIAFAAGTVYFSRKGVKPDVYSVICGAVSVMLAIPFAVTSNYAVKLLSLPAAIILEWIWFASLAGKKIPDGDFGLVSLLLGSFVNGISDMPRSVKAIASNENSKNRNGVKAVIGIICALPVTLLLLSLLSKSDAAFEGLLDKIFSDFSVLIFQIILTLIISPFINGYAVSLKHRDKTALELKEPKGFDTAFLTAFLSLISLCYVVYLFSQTAYFFSAFSGILPQGYEFSYAEYARRGFFELCIISAINLLLIFFTVVFAKKKNGKLPVILRILGCFIGIFTLSIIATAFSKMVIYINNFGMTVLRIGTSAFMIFIALVFVAVIIRCFTDKVKILQFAAVTAGIILVLLGGFNINSVVAEYNCNAYAQGRLSDVDVRYLESIGEEAVPCLVKLLDDKDKCAEAKVSLFYVANLLYESDENDYEILTGKYCTKFYEKSVSLVSAYNSIDEIIEKDREFFCGVTQLEISE